MTQMNSSSSSGKKRKRKHSSEKEPEYGEVALEQLPMNALRRYKRAFKLQTRPQLPKPQLAEIVQRHFRSMPVNEKEALAYFIYMVKMNKNKLDNKDASQSGGNDEGKEHKYSDKKD